MKSLLVWNLLAGLVLALQLNTLPTIQSSSYLRDDANHGRLQSWPNHPSLQRRATPRKGITRSSSTPNLYHALPLHLSKETNRPMQDPLPGIKGHSESPLKVSLASSAPNPRHGIGLRLSKDQESPRKSLPKIKTHPDVPAGASPVSDYRTPFSSVHDSPASSQRYSTLNHLTNSPGIQTGRSDASVVTAFSTAAASSQPVGSSAEMFIRHKTKPESKPETPAETPEKGFASRIGRPLLWVQNNPAKAMRMGVSMAANAASGGAAIAAAHHNVPGAASLAIASAVMKVGIDCYDGKDKVHTWHKQKCIDPKENVEATRRVVKAAKKPVSDLWRTISRPLSSQQSVDKPWPIDGLPVRKRSIENRRIILQYE